MLSPFTSAVATNVWFLVMVPMTEAEVSAPLRTFTRFTSMVTVFGKPEVLVLLPDVGLEPELVLVLVVLPEPLFGVQVTPPLLFSQTVPLNR